MKAVRLSEMRAFLLGVYEKYGPLVARQYAYRAETARLIKKSKQTFDYVNRVLVGLREDGSLPWSAVLDSSRDYSPRSVDAEPEADYLSSWKDSFRGSWDDYHVSVWVGQPTVPVVVTEKEGLVSYFDRVARKFDVSVYPIKGQAGKSHLHEEFLPWLREIVASDRAVRILYLGDLDDYGYEIENGLVATLREWGARFTHDRIALRPDQVHELGVELDPIQPRPNTLDGKYHLPGKAEIEAVEPNELRRLLQTEIEAEIDLDIRAEGLALELKAKGRLKRRIGALVAGWKT